MVRRRRSARELPAVPGFLLGRGSLPSPAVIAGRPEWATTLRKSLAWARVSRVRPARCKRYCPTVPDRRHASGWLVLAANARRLGHEGVRRKIGRFPMCSIKPAMTPEQRPLESSRSRPRSLSGGITGKSAEAMRFPTSPHSTRSTENRCRRLARVS